MPSNCGITTEAQGDEDTKTGNDDRSEGGTCLAVLGEGIGGSSGWVRPFSPFLSLNFDLMLQTYLRLESEEILDHMN